MLPAERTILVQLHTVGGVLLVLDRVVVSLLAFRTRHRDFNAHSSAPPSNLALPPGQKPVCLPEQGIKKRP